MKWMKPYEKLGAWLQGSGYEAILVTKSENIGYLSGFWGSFGAYLQTKSGERRLLTDGRYQELATDLGAAEGFEFILFSGETPTDFTGENLKSIAVESSMTLAALERYQGWFDETELKSETGVVEQLRRVKSAAELDIMRAAQAHVDDVLVPLLQAELRNGITERGLKFKLDQALQAEGRYGLSFDSIVAFGPGSALPHYHSGERELKPGMNILIDCGVVDRHYCSDMTRNFVFGEASSKYLEDYAMLLDKQQQALLGVKSGVEAKTIDLACRDRLAERAELFIHSLGHGVGLEIHEAPTLSKRSEDVLQTHEVVTVEPGIYRAGEYGIRIEDMLIVLPGGSEILTQTTKDLLSFDERGRVHAVANAS